MTKIKINLAVSIDGFVAGPDQSLENPLGVGGMQVHEWAFATRSFHAMQGKEGGETGVDDEHAAARLSNVGAVIMGRNMFGPVRGPWEEHETWNGWWGDDPPYHSDVFVLTHHPRDSVEMQGGTTFHFVTDGIEAALERARGAAGDRDISIAGGAEAARQYLRARLVDEVTLDVAPVVLGSGERLLDGLGGLPGYAFSKLDSSAVVAHYTYVRTETA